MRQPHMKLLAVLTPSLMWAILALPAVAGNDPVNDCPTVRKFAEGVISSDAWEWRLTFTPWRHQAYFARTEGWWPATREQATILTTYRLPWGWSAPRVASFSGIHSDMDPFVSPDGRYMIFSSERPRPDGVEAKMDLWIAERGWWGWGWREPVHLGDAVNSAGDELYASMDRHGMLYFASDRAGEFDIYRSERHRDGSFGPAEKVPGKVNTTQRWEFNPEISPDGRTLLFVRLFDDSGYGFGDIHVSRLRNSGFGEGINLGPCVNTAFDEFHPSVLWERKLLFFARDSGAPSDFYVTRLRLPSARAADD